MNLESANKTMEELQEKYEGKFGLICIKCLLHYSRIKDLEEFIKKNDIPLSSGNLEKVDYLSYIVSYFYEVYKNNSNLQDLFSDPIHYIGDIISKDESLKHYLSYFDFYSKADLIDGFSDFCADLGITVYNAQETDEYTLDLYLVRRTPFLRTESAIVRTGYQLDEEEYKNIFYHLNQASEISTWNVFVTTSYGAYRIGLNRLISDMKKLDIWLYIVDPAHKAIWGITKGGKNKNYDSDLRDKYIEKLPHEPIRAPSKVMNISDYYFSESDSYKSDSFRMFSLLPNRDISEDILEQREKTYRDIFQGIIVIGEETGLPLFSHFVDEEKVDNALISGLLSAMDNFISEISGSTNMQEINYKGFNVQATYGDKIKVALFLSESADKALRERLAYFVMQFEKRYEEAIDKFQKDGETSLFEKKSILRMTQEILDI
jgi:hypothetical protein